MRRPVDWRGALIDDQPEPHRTRLRRMRRHHVRVMVLGWALSAVILAAAIVILLGL